MSEGTVFTIDDLTGYLRSTVSEHRFIHSLGVATTTESVLEHFGCTNYQKSWKGLPAPRFCGLAHDLGREYSDAQILSFCEKRNIILPFEDIKAPVLAHGIVSAEIAQDLVGMFPMSWYKALSVHTTGNAGMDDLALALFIADYIEPSRVFMTDERRSYYLESESIQQCAYKVLCDMIEHWRKTGFHNPSGGSLMMEEELRQR